MTSADVPEVGVIYTIEYVGVQEFEDGVESSAVTHGRLENWIGEMIPDPLLSIPKKRDKTVYYRCREAGKCGVNCQHKVWHLYVESCSRGCCMGNVMCIPT